MPKRLIITHLNDGEGNAQCGAKARRSVMINKTTNPQAVTCKKCFKAMKWAAIEESAAPSKSVCDLCGENPGNDWSGHWWSCPKCRAAVAIHGTDKWIEFVTRRIAAGRKVHPDECVRCGEEVDQGKKRCDICDEIFFRVNERR